MAKLIFAPIDWTLVKGNMLKLSKIVHFFSPLSSLFSSLKNDHWRKNWPKINSCYAKISFLRPSMKNNFQIWPTRIKVCPFLVDHIKSQNNECNLLSRAALSCGEKTIASDVLHSSRCAIFQKNKYQVIFQDKNWRWEREISNQHI